MDCECGQLLDGVDQLVEVDGLLRRVGSGLVLTDKDVRRAVGRNEELVEDFESPGASGGLI